MRAKSRPSGRVLKERIFADAGRTLGVANSWLCSREKGPPQAPSFRGRNANGHF